MRPDQSELFTTIRRPVLVVAGREDTTFPLPEVQRMAEVIPGAELQILDEAAHLVALEVPDTVNKLVDEFIDRRGGRLRVNRVSGTTRRSDWRVTQPGSTPGDPDRALGADDEVVAVGQGRGDLFEGGQVVGGQVSSRRWRMRCMVTWA